MKLRFALIALLVPACHAAAPIEPDAAADAPGTDASPRGTVFVQTLDPAGDGSALLGTRVVFADPDGTIVGTVTVDDTGAAQGEILPGGSVTAVFQTEAATYDVESVLDVDVGDHLRLSQTAGDHSNPHTMTVSFPPVAGAESYAVVGPCGLVSTTSSPVTVDLDAQCNQAPIDVFVGAYDEHGVFNTILEADDLGDVPTNDLTGTWQALQPFSITCNNVPAGVSSLGSFRYEGHVLPWSVLGLDNGLQTISTSSTESSTVSVGLTNARASMMTYIEHDQTLAKSLVIESIAGDATSYEVDVGTNALPWLAAPTYDFDAGAIDVVYVSNGTSPDLMTVLAPFVRQRSDGSSLTVRWRVIAPFASQVVLPAMPSDLKDVVPVTGDAIDSFDAVSDAFDWPSVDGYSAALHDFHDAELQHPFQAPSSGVLRVTTSSL